MTIQAIKSRMVKEIPEIETVHADTGASAGADGDLGGTSSGGGMSPSFPGETTDDDGDDEGPQAPF
jgi:hypothetical protein